VTSFPITPARIIAAHERIAPYIRRTPVITVDGQDFGLPAE
jgi:threonine dehydratase